MSQIEIPTTIEEAVSNLDGLGRLLTAKQWERAAIVYAFTRDGVPGEGGPGRADKTDKQGRGFGHLLASEFAGLGITGLKTQDSVRAYRTRWQEAIDAGEASEVSPGETIDLPDLNWEPLDTSSGTPDNRRRSLLSQARKLPDDERARLLRELQGPIVDPVQDHPQPVPPQPEPVDVSTTLNRMSPEERSEVGKALLEDPYVGDDLRREVNKAEQERWRERREAARERTKREEQREHTIRYLELKSKMTRMRQQLARWAKDVRDIPFDDEELDLLRGDIEEVRAALNLLSMAVEGSTDIDWDAGLRRLGV